MGEMSLRRTFAAAAVVAALVVSLASCGNSEKRQNVRPPAPGVPTEITEISGIYRSVHQGVLQLRATGDFIMIIPDGVGATSGSFALDDGTVLVSTKNCGTDIGTYKLKVTGEQAPGKAALVFEAVQDPCQERSRYLTVDPWVYAVS
ncbi:MAG: hypothetical protein QOJ69_701 [Actinomycetota bacterium]|nr:hypothetical protein [Actinomycetota bacterium]